MNFNLWCEQRFSLFPTNHQFPVGALLGSKSISLLGWWVSPDLPPLQIEPMDLENASPFLESHESHVEEGKSYDFGHLPHKGSKWEFKLQCEQRDGILRLESVSH